MGFSFQDMSLILGVSVRTIRRRRQELGLPIGYSHCYSSMTDLDLDEQVREILQVQYAVL